MHGLQTNERLNAEVVIKGVLRRAADRGVTPTRNEMFEALKYREDDDVSQWEATVNAMMTSEDLINTAELARAA